MSVLRHTLILIPDKYSDKEVKQVRDMECPRCNGRGGFSEQIGHDKYKFTTCSLCVGAKKVKATVTIKWEPDFGS